MKRQKLYYLFTLGLLSSLLLIFGCGREFDPLLVKGQKLLKEQRYIEVIDTVSLALSVWREPDGKEKRAKAYELLGKAHEALRQSDKAIVAFEQAIQLSNKTFDSAYELGVIYLASSKYNLAAKAFQNALRMRKEDPLALVGLGNAYYGLRDYDSAILAYQRVLDSSPGVRQAIQFKALAEKKAGQKDRRK